MVAGYRELLEMKIRLIGEARFELTTSSSSTAPLLTRQARLSMRVSALHPDSQSRSVGMPVQMNRITSYGVQTNRINLASLRSCLTKDADQENM